MREFHNDSRLPATIKHSLSSLDARTADFSHLANRGLALCAPKRRRKLSHEALALCLIISLTGCAQVPKESVELSTTVGRDISIVYKSHRELAKLLFGRMRQDVNRFVDNVYAPYQIRAVMEGDFNRSQSANESDRNASILLAMNNAFKPGATMEQQRNVLNGMEFLVTAVREDVESRRKELLKPLEEQENQVMSALDRNYAQIIYGNSIVTGYLSSVVKVRDAQNEVLQAIGADANLSDVIGKKLAAASDKISTLVDNAEKANAKAKAASTEGSIKNTLDDLKKTVSDVQP